MSEGTYSRKPFISFDLAPGNAVERAEVEVNTGYGKIVKLEENKNSHRVEFQVDNNQYGASANVSTKSPLFAKVKEAFESGTPVFYRFERHRKPGVDRSKPMSEVAPRGDMGAARKNIFKSLTAIRTDESEDWTISSTALTRIEEDSKFDGSAGGINVQGMTWEEFQAATGGSSAPAAQATTGTGRAPANYGFEPTPWFTTNSRGEINPGSQAVAVPLTVYGFVDSWFTDHKIEVENADKLKFTVTSRLIETMNNLQLAIYDGELTAPDLSLGSHTRARHITFDVIRQANPLTADDLASPESLDAWASSLEERALRMWKWSIGLVGKIEAVKNA